MNMMKLTRGILVLSLGIVMMTFVFPANAQSDGQFCVRAYDDRNANGIRDASEPTLTGGISAELTEENGIVIASALLADSPTASQGIICFEGLAPGQYSIIVTSADFAPTTPNTMTVAIQSGDLPSVLEFGARNLDTDGTITDIVNDVEPSPQQALERLLIAVLGAVVATIVMLVIGIVIFLIFFRGRTVQEEEVIVTSTDEMFRPPSDTGQY